jgi:16S rRNA A1518/A1519 N6-dimethyltransferase RsmA/KsgA/DIM1 with predicted DNA glycosylase/AP lyase activity
MIFWLLALLVFCFSFVLLFGAPYLPTLHKQAEAAFVLLDLKPGDTLIELGCGDGKLLRMAAKKGYKAVGYELNPLLYLLALVSTLKYRGAVRVKCSNFWYEKLPKAEAVFVFLLPKYMEKLDNFIVQQYGKNIKLVSFAFEIKTRKPNATKDGVFLYKY